MPKDFIWLAESSLPRKGMPELIKGATHKVSDYSAEIVKEWVKSGVAKMVDEKNRKKEKG